MAQSIKSDAGLTILEVLLAFALIGLGVTLTMQVYHRSAAQTAALAREHRALRAMENAIESVRAAPFDSLQPGERPLPLFDPTADPAGVPMEGVLRVERHPEIEGLLRVTAETRWTARGPRRVTRSLTTLVADQP